VASFSVLRRLSQVGVIPLLVPGQYHIRLFNAGGTQLADYQFSPTSTTQGGSSLQIAQVVNFVPGTRRIAIFRIWQAGRLQARRSARRRRSSR